MFELWSLQTMLITAVRNSWTCFYSEILLLVKAFYKQPILQKGSRCQMFVMHPLVFDHPKVASVHHLNFSALCRNRLRLASEFTTPLRSVAGHLHFSQDHCSWWVYLFWKKYSQIIIQSWKSTRILINLPPNHSPNLDILLSVFERCKMIHFFL